MDLFGIQSSYQEAQLILLPVPWDLTTSYGKGTCQGPEAIANASVQMDLFDRELGEAWRHGFYMEKPDAELKKVNLQLRQLSQKITEGDGSATELAQINSACNEMVQSLKQKASNVLAENKFMGVVGGDHSVPLGAIEAFAEKHGTDFGILHIDAHADLRQAYQGFTHSHASIMYNVMTSEFRPRKLVQVGIRDFCREEFEFIKKNDGTIATFFDADYKKDLFSGQSWQSLCERMISPLPDKVYISFDIDGLSPEFCPNTGTPVPGGLNFDQVSFLLSQLKHSGRQIIGFDLVEVAPGENSEWDANVGMRLLYKLCGWTVKSNGL